MSLHLSSLTLALTILAVALLTVAAHWYWRRLLTEERERRRQLLAGRSALRKIGDDWRRSQGAGQIAILAVGSYGARQLPTILTAFLRAGAESHIGVVLLIELDQEVRQIALGEIPDVFRQRIVIADCPLLPAGLLGASVEQAIQQRELWLGEVGVAAQEWMRRLERETSPALLLCLISPGGSAALGYPVVTRFAARYPRQPIFGFTILDEKLLVRQRFPELRSLYMRHGHLRGLVVLDNQRQSERGDVGLATLLSAMVAATWVGERPLELWNGLQYVLSGDDSRRYATISVWGESFPVYHDHARWGALPPLAYSVTDILHEKVIRGIRAVVEDAELRAVELPAAADGRLQLVYVSLPLIPEPDLHNLADRVEESLRSWKTESTSHLLIRFASTSVLLDEHVLEAPVVVVMLQGLDDEGHGLDRLAREVGRLGLRDRPMSEDGGVLSALLEDTVAYDGGVQ